jgi:hypothetical protein
VCHKLGFKFGERENIFIILTGRGNGLLDERLLSNLKYKQVILEANLESIHLADVRYSF